MNAAPQQPASPQARTLPERDAMMVALSHPTRWAILDVLANGEGYGVPDLEPLVKTSRSNVSKQLMILKQAGLIVMGRGYLYHVPRAFNPNPGSRTLDFGHALLRFDPPDPQ